MAGVEGTGPVKCSRDIVIVPDTSLTDAVQKGPYDAVVLPGGAGYTKFAAVSSLLKFDNNTVIKFIVDITIFCSISRALYV